MPPASRFLTAGIPANNFGVNATFEVGALQLQTIAATQKGSQIAERIFCNRCSRRHSRRTVQIRDLDFESGRFFWVVDPPSLRDIPRSTSLRWIRQRCRRPTGQSRSGSTATAPGPTRAAPTRISAVSLPWRGAADSNQRVGPLQSLWQLLVPGVDYYLDPSGLWFVLATRLDLSDYLAVSYITAGGDSVGTFPAEDNPRSARTA